MYFSIRNMRNLDNSFGEVLFKLHNVVDHYAIAAVDQKEEEITLANDTRNLEVILLT